LKVSIITGVSGQDGAYLSRLLLRKGYRVIGLIRSQSGTNLDRLRYLGVMDQIELVECDLRDLTQVLQIVRTYNPDEIYNLAAQSHVHVSFEIPEYTGDVTGLGAVRILQAGRETCINTRI